MPARPHLTEDRDARSLVEEGREVDVAEGAQLGLDPPDGELERLADLGEDQLGGDPVEGEVAAGGRNGKPASACRSTSARVPPLTARSRWCQRNWRRCWVMRSTTVQTALPSAQRSPRPRCWRNTVALSVGRSRVTVDSADRQSERGERSGMRR
jgi:hypothetical protein